MNIKQYLKKNGIKLGALILVVAMVVGISSYVHKGRAGVVQNVTGTVKTPIQQMVSSIADWLESVYGYVYKYDALQAENERLHEELAEAQKQVRDSAEALEENERYRELLEFDKKHSDMTYEAAKVVSWTTSNWANAFSISKGESSGIELGDPVVTENGVVVGQITELGKNWATVSTVIDINSNIGARVSDTGSAGLLAGDFVMMQDGYAKLAYLSEGAQIFAGSIIVTSGSGGAFPPNLIIGTVTSVQQEAGGQIEYGMVKPNCDLDSLVQVFVIKDFEVVE